ncbi:hypothetical protein DFQ26_004060 [Actinomortierella ambigua]|nr:hypothetical protein DFQ26_004060 [Actinomortierella ambigua]
MSDIQKGVQAFERLLKTDEGVKTGTCRKCGGGGHLTFECRNMFKLDDKAKKPKRASRFGFIKGRLGSAAGSPTSQTLDKPETAASPIQIQITVPCSPSSSSIPGPCYTKAEETG